MASRIWEIQVTVQPGTSQSAPLVTPWITEDNILVSVELTVPPGHNGLTGIRIMKGDVPLIPYNSGSFIIANNYVHDYPVADYVPSSDISIQTFNTGGYPHTFYLRATIETYTPQPVSPYASTSQAIPTGTVTESPVPLSPDSLLGISAASQLASGNITADDLLSSSAAEIETLPGQAPRGL